MGKINTEMRHLDAKKKIKMSRMQMQKEKNNNKNKVMCHTDAKAKNIKTDAENKVSESVTQTGKKWVAQT